MHLRNICAKEGIEAEEDALHIIAQKADGALRDALSIFDRITSFSGKKITYDDVIENLNVLDYDYYFQITDALLAEDAPAILNLFDQISRKGFEPDVFINGLAEHLRNILVCKDAATLALLEVGESLRERYRKQAALAPAAFLLTALNICNDCDVNFKMARNRRLHVEMALLKMCYINRAVKAAQTVAPEKKTPDVNTVDNRRSTADGKEKETTPPSPDSQQPAPGPESPAQGNALPLSRSEMIELASGLRQGLKKAEAIPLRLDAYEQAVEVEEAEKAALESRLTLENARLEWKAYAESVDSKLVRLALLGAELRLEDKKIVAVVATNTDRSHLQSELMRLLDTLRSRLHDPRLKVQIEIDEARAQALLPQAPKRPLTAKEKLDTMREINPVVTDLLQRFDLRLDE